MAADDDVPSVAYHAPAGGYPEANGLAPLSYHGPESGTPCYKSIPVRITKANG